MYDSRMKKLADILVRYSIELGEGETVYVEVYDTPKEMIEVLIDSIYEVGAIPLLNMSYSSIFRKILLGATKQSMDIIGNVELNKIKKSDAYICLKGPENVADHSDIPQDKINLYRKYYWDPVHIKHRVEKTRWVTLRWPTQSMAQQANMSTETFENYYFDVCTMDYSKMSNAMDSLKNLMENTNEVRILARGTDLKFSIKDMPVIKCDGHENLPDGEIYTAPIKESLQGEITFNTQTIHMGNIFSNIHLKFQNGKVVKASTSNIKLFNEIIKTDEGARYIGEFGIGLNPYINKPITDIIFDEKIAGSIHLALGNAYKKADNRNRSKIHWDLIQIHSNNMGGGEIYFDGKLIRKDGIFVIDDLKSLNPKNLINLYE